MNVVIAKMKNEKDKKVIKFSNSLFFEMGASISTRTNTILRDKIECLYVINSSKMTTLNPDEFMKQFGKI